MPQNARKPTEMVRLSIISGMRPAYGTPSSDRWRALRWIAGEASRRAGDLPSRGKIVEHECDLRRYRRSTFRRCTRRKETTDDAVGFVCARARGSAMRLDVRVGATRLRFRARVRNRRERRHQELEHRGEDPAEAVEARTSHRKRIIVMAINSRHGGRRRMPYAAPES